MNMKKALSLLCVCLMMITGLSVMVKANTEAAITYRFVSARAGYAEGSVTLAAEAAGKYTLYWADDSAALEDWFPIAQMDLKAGESGSYAFGERVAIPASATKLIAVKEGADPLVSSAAAVYTIPSAKRFPHTAKERKYRFGALSDIHIDVQDGGKNTYYTNASKNFKLALDNCAAHDADFIITAGDMITNASGAALEWMEYQRVIADSDYADPIYEAIGNHETRYPKYAECDIACGIEEFIVNTGLDGTAETMTKRKPYFEITEPATGDHFIFMALEAGYNPAEVDNFTDEQMDWVEGLVKRYTGDGHRIFLIQHSPIMGYGAGDDSADPAYDGSFYADERFKNNLRFKNLIESHKDIIWLSGHTHVDFADDVNYSDENGASCKMFHIPSVANTTRLSYDEDGNRTLDRTFYEDTTQGYLVDVYDDAAILGGVNFYHDRYYPAYSYIVGDTAEAALPTQSQTETPTEQPVLYGDADDNGEVEILDATAIQRHLAGIRELSEQGIRAAKVTGGSELNILDATAIQRKLAGLIKAFPVEEQIAQTGASTVLQTAKAELSACYQYASYPAYAALKKAYRASDASAAEAALSAFRAIKSKVKLSTVYFSDSEKMDNVHAYAWKSASGRAIEAWPGQKPTYVKTNSYGQNVYAITVDTAIWDRIVFSNGSDKKTADIPLTGQSGRVYYPIGSSAPYQVTYDIFEKNWYDDPADTATIYFTDTEGWNNIKVYWWTDSANNGWPGTEMSFVRKSSSGKSIYQATAPKNAKVVFSGGTSQTVDIPAIADGFGYYPYQKNSDNKWQVVEYPY